MRTLDQLRPGERGTIVSVEGSDGIALRLRELGLVPGERIEFVRRAPLGDPLKCLVQGCRIAVRATEARRIEVALEARPLGEPSTS